MNGSQRKYTGGNEYLLTCHTQALEQFIPFRLIDNYEESMRSGVLLKKNQMGIPLGIE
jgi:hypothetical protein